MEMLKRQLQRELSGGHRELQDILPSTVYANIAGVDADAIQDYLKNTTCYSTVKGRWDLPRDTSTEQPFHEEALYDPFKKIVSSILRNFQVESASVENTHNQCMVRLEDYLEEYVDQEDNEVKSKIAPDLCIMGNGRTFRPKIQGETRPSYFNCIALLEIKTTRTMKKVSFEDVILQVAVYVRQCFAYQANRFFACAVIATEEHFHLLVFDRAGTMRTAGFNLHEEAATFVRVIIGMSSHTSRQLSSFDPDIKFLGCNSDHLKMNLKDYISVDSGTTRSYQIVLNDSPFLRKAIRGRGTRCWLGTITPANIHVTVKESWRSQDRSPEWKLLLKAIGLEGVCQMVAYTDDETTSISKLRSVIIEDFAFASGEIDRIFTRVVLEAYGPAIHYFKTPLQMLYTFRDAVAGHRALWMNNILHRDVSPHNILIGKADAQVGNRGILIDLDMAIDITSYVPSQDPLAGTRAFQSVMTLHPDACILPQDHRDDLESFYYVLLWICSFFIAPRKLINRAVLQSLEDSEDDICAAFKFSLLFSTRRVLSPWFTGTPFMDLLATLGKTLQGWVRNKNNTLIDTNPDNAHQLPSVQEIRADVGSRDHDLFLEKIDHAIQALLTDKDDFGQSKGVELHGHETIDLEDDDVSAPVINNQATLLCGAATKRGRPHDRHDEAEENTKRAQLEGEVSAKGISRIHITNVDSISKGV